MRRSNDDEAFTALFLQFSRATEKWLKRTLIFLLIALFLFQALLRIPALRQYLASADKYEGMPIHRENRN
ncbi:hypothetical protein [Paenibacillus macerans]|uniref:hypothetical protein n=1 Tax=Paenibacillus macerans TaxID=44252 RepID=UPI003D31BC1D